MTKQIDLFWQNWRPKNDETKRFISTKLTAKKLQNRKIYFDKTGGYKMTKQKYLF